MNIINIPTEQTTALTDFLMGVLLVVLFTLIYSLSQAGKKRTIWLLAYGFLMFASFLGAVAHGFEMSAELNNLLWQPLNFALGMVIAMFVVAASYDLWGEKVYPRLAWIMTAVAIVFYGITVLIPGTFLTFIAYEALAMLFALGVYIYLALTKRLKGAWWMVLGILLSITAAAVQALGKSGEVMFLGLDHNGVFHVIQMPGVIALLVGVKKSL